MRRLRRPRYIVPTLSDAGPGGGRRLAHCSEYEQAGNIPASLPGHWTNPDVKGFLFAMQGAICAYCGMESGLDVEHFRPKRGPVSYWWLAYESSNYLLCCTPCNRQKGASFPLLPGGMRCTYETRDRIGEELRLLLDPAEDHVEKWLTIGPGDMNCKLIPNPDLNAVEKSRVQHVIDLFRLNESVVRRQRSRAYEAAVRAASQGQWEKLRQSAMRHRPHSLVAKIVLQRVAPEHLPGAEEEMRDHITSLWNDLVFDLEYLRTRGKRNPAVDQRQIQILVWALVVLRNDPPFGDSESVAGHFAELLEHDESGLKDEIAALFGSCSNAAR